jgi:hypothetical protein
MEDAGSMRAAANPYVTLQEAPPRRNRAESGARPAWQPVVIVSRGRNPDDSPESGSTQTFGRAAGTRCSASKCATVSAVRLRTVKHG